MNKTIKEVGNAMDKYEYSLASTYLYNFVYDDFCSNYLEMSKVSLNINDEQYKKIIKSVLVDVLKNIILMIYPYAPFISEELYLNLPSHLESIMLESYPQYEDINIEFNQVELLYKIITDIRNYKVNAKLAPNYKIKLVIETKLDLFEGFNDYLSRFSFASDIKKVVNSDSKGTKFVYDNLNVYIEDNITEEEKNAKKAKDIAYLEAEIKRCEGLLNNPNFVNKAPESKVKLEQEKLAKYKEQLANLK